MILSDNTVFTIEQVGSFYIVGIGNGWYLDWIRSGNELHWVRLTDNITLASQYESDIDALGKIEQVRNLISNSTSGFDEIELNLQQSNHIIAHTRKTELH